MNDQINFGNRRLVGQKKAREQIEKAMTSGRLGHAYLLTGPKGSGKMAFALAFAELINGIDHFTDLSGHAFSKKSSWYTHPDIHVFIPIPSGTEQREVHARLELLQKDPYEIIDFALRPVITDPGSSKNLQAFYPIKYYLEEIRPVTIYKPNEGKKTVVIISDIETMRKETANAFLKLLEEPSENVLFILTSSKTDQLLPTIVSRCQQIRLQPLSSEEIEEGLTDYDSKTSEDASFLARVSDGSYSLARFFEIDELKQTRSELVDFLRFSYTQDAKALTDLISAWQKRLNRESQIGLCNALEQLLRDIIIYRETGLQDLIINIDQIDVIKRFAHSMQHARLHDMVEHLQHLKVLLYQNIQFKFVLSALSFRFFALLRGDDPYINKQEAWKHLPAFSEL